jgi:hypothetical protein
MFSSVSKLTALAGFLLLTGCGDSGLTTPSPLDEVPAELATVAAASQNVMIPVTWTYHMAAAGTDMLVCPNSDGSPPFMAISVHYNATGRMTHLGRLDSSATGATFSSCVVNVVEGMPITAVGAATVDLTGANGDAVFLEGTLTLHFSDMSATGEWTIAGGTGRFDGASGWIQTWEQPEEDGSGSVGSGEGMISPPGMLMK